MNSKFDVRIPLPPILVMILCVVATAKLLPVKPMLDERFLLAWAHAKPGAFLWCTGLLPGEQWGPLTPFSILVSQWLSFGVPWIWRLHNVLIYTIGSLALFHAARRITSVTVAMLVTVLIAGAIALVLPVAWLGARGFLLAYCLVSIALAIYVRRDRRILVAISLSVLCFAIALAASLSWWMAAFAFPLVEAILWFRTPSSSRDKSISTFAPLLFFVVLTAPLVGFGFRPTEPHLAPLKMPASESRFAATMRSTFAKKKLVVIADLPERLAPSPYFVSNGAIVYDGSKSAVAANRVTGGLLKDALRANRAPVECFRWDLRHQMFSPVYLNFEGENAPTEFDGSKLANLMEPPLAFIKTAAFDEKENAISIKSELATTGPVMRVSGRWLNPTIADFIWIDAKIESPRSDISSLDMYWTTSLLPEYESKRRHEKSPAWINDGKFHRYYFPIRDTAWFCSGQPQQLTFGFPIQSTAQIKTIGTTTKDKLCPDVKLDIKTDRRATAVPCFAFPNIPDLGLYVADFDAQTLPATFHVQPGATGILFEISLPNKDFENPNGSKLSGVTFTTCPIDGTGPTAELAIADLPETAVYAVRGIAMDKGHNPIGNFSDTLYVLIQKPNSLGWRTR
jgi:hypothetical protein